MNSSSLGNYMFFDSCDYTCCIYMFTIYSLSLVNMVYFGLINFVNEHFLYGYSKQIKPSLPNLLFHPLFGLYYA